MIELRPHEQALARSKLYGLLARLFIRGVDELALARLEALGWLAPGHAPDLLEQLAAEHHASFSLGVFPFAGVFLDASASAGGLDDRVRSHFANAGFAPRLDELPADHLGVELAFLAFLSGAVADAIEDGRAELVALLEHWLAEFLDACVLGWLPAFVCAVEELPERGFWALLASETLALVAEHRTRLPGPIVPVSLHDPGDLLADEQTGLRRIVEHLLTPVASGWFASRFDIAALARARELPRGFGSRALMLDNLLRSAVEYGELAPLLAALDDRLAQRDHSLARIAAASGLDLAVAPWRDALVRTRALLERIATPCTSKPSTTTPPAP